MTNNPGFDVQNLTINQVKQLCVIGAGTMGAQIAQVAALHGYKVNLTDANQTALERAMEGNRHQLQLRVKKGKLSQTEADLAWARVTPLTSLEEAVRAADFVIEAIQEDLPAKQTLFRRLDSLCPPHTILASNSSTSVISRIAADITRKDRACNMHFFHPALVMELIEVGRGPDTSDNTIEVTTELGRRLGKEVVVMQKEIFGFLVNNLLSPQLESAPLKIESDAGLVENIEKAVQSSLHHPMRPFELDDFSRAGLVHSVKQPKHKETSDPRDRPPQFLEEMVKEGRPGRSGSYNYSR